MSVPLLTHSALFGSDLCEFAPAAVIAGVGICTWEGGAGSRGAVSVLPDGCADLMWDGDALRISGVQPGVVNHPVTTTRTVGVRLHPGALGAVVGIPASEVPPGVVDLTDLWGRAAREWSGRLASAAEPARARGVLETLVATRLATGGPPDPLLAAATRWLAAPRASVDDVARRTGLSARELRRRFRHDVGPGPKHLQRILRFRLFVRSLPALVEHRTSMARVAAELGYADQAHISRECRELAGRTPRSLVATCAAHAERQGPGTLWDQPRGRSSGRRSRSEAVWSTPR